MACTTVQSYGLYIGPIFRESTAPFRNILLLHNVPIHRNNLMANIHWTLTVCMKRTYHGTYLTFGRVLNDGVIISTYYFNQIKHRRNKWPWGTNLKFKVTMLSTCSQNISVSSSVCCIFPFRKHLPSYRIKNILNGIYFSIIMCTILSIMKQKIMCRDVVIFQYLGSHNEIHWCIKLIYDY